MPGEAAAEDGSVEKASLHRLRAVRPADAAPATDTSAISIMSRGSATDEDGFGSSTPSTSSLAKMPIGATDFAVFVVHRIVMPLSNETVDRLYQDKRPVASEPSRGR